MATDYLTTADVLGLHRVLMQRYGGTPGLRDAGALESALFRPQTGYYEDIVAEAAALMESLPSITPSSMATSASPLRRRMSFCASMAGACIVPPCRSMKT